jgi:hypothetical protein
MPPCRRPSAPRRAPGTSRSLANMFVPKFLSSFFSKTQRPRRQLNPFLHDPYAYPPPPPPPPAPVLVPVPVQAAPVIPRLREREISRPRNLRRSPHPAYRIAHPHFVHILPFEILALIFVLGTEEDPNLPITVSHVCRQWREIALQTPSLWRRISLSPHEHRWREQIHRSRACSLDVELKPWRTTREGIRRSQDLNAYSVQWYMYLVLPFIHRWRSLDLLFTDHSPYMWRAALAGCGTPAPALEELSLVYRFNDNSQEFLLFAESAPNLRRLTVDGIRLAWSPRLFGNLTFLDYTHHGFTSGHQAVHDVISILSTSNRLQELRILFPRGRYASLPPRRDYATKRVRLRSLRTLQLSVDGSDIPFELAHLVTLIHAPNLTTLKLIDITHSYHSFPSLKSFFFVFSLPRSLRVMQIGYGWYDHRMIQPLSQGLPALSKIVIKRSRAPEQVLELIPPLKETGSVRRTRRSSQRHYHMNHSPYYTGR